MRCAYPTCPLHAAGPPTRPALTCSPQATCAITRSHRAACIGPSSRLDIAAIASSAPPHFIARGSIPRPAPCCSGTNARPGVRNLGRRIARHTHDISSCMLCSCSSMASMESGEAVQAPAASGASHWLYILACGAQRSVCQAADRPPVWQGSRHRASWQPTPPGTWRRRREGVHVCMARWVLFCTSMLDRNHFLGYP